MNKKEALWLDEQEDLLALVTDHEQIEIDGRRYARLKQKSTAIYYGRWGKHQIEEWLYREAGVRNGPTVKPG